MDLSDLTYADAVFAAQVVTNGDRVFSDSAAAAPRGEVAAMVDSGYVIHAEQTVALLLSPLGQQATRFQH